MIMQMMTDSSCVHRVALDACAPTPTVLATVIFHPNAVCFAPGFSSGRQPIACNSADDKRRVG
jgi:hypothetical protein